jgi:ABC-2 type transport system ATP-binding protein
MGSAIEVRGLTKSYGRTLAVDDLSFRIEPGRVTGFVGPNGAGKSTTMRLVLGLDAPDAGEARVGGRRYRDLRAPLREVGALLDAGSTHPGRRARAHLLWLARSNRLPTRRVDEVLELVGLEGARGTRTGRYSLGMAQRLGIAAALLGDPPVLLFDEPVNGLDPDGIRWIRSFLRSLADEGRTVLVCSHLMGELEGVADELVVIGRGRLITQATVTELLSTRSDGRVHVRTPQVAAVMAVLAGAGGAVTSPDTDTLVVSGLDPEQIAELVAARGLPLHELYRERASLEDAFIELTRDAVEFAADARGESS